MHIDDIKAVALRINLDDKFAGRNAQVVVILPKDGERHYIARTGGTTLNRDEAFVYDFDRHRVSDQCQQVMIAMGVTPEVEEV